LEDNIDVRVMKSCEIPLLDPPAMQYAEKTESNDKLNLGKVSADSTADSIMNSGRETDATQIGGRPEAPTTKMKEWAFCR